MKASKNEGKRQALADLKEKFELLISEVDLGVAFKEDPEAKKKTAEQNANEWKIA